jgi:hypothetical protein
MSLPENFERAFFQPETGSQRDQIDVHFNPVSLQYVITNTLKDKGTGNKKKQYVSQSTGKLTMELIFDTTDTGQDVRVTTEKIGKFMEPDTEKIPPVVQFEWGTYKFKGMVESYKETIDFFAPNGVPLRASVNLTMSRQDNVFESTDGSSGFTPDADLQLDDVELPPASGPDGDNAGSGGGAQSASGVASRAGDPRAARALAAANNLESMRFSGGASLVVGGSVRLKPPVAFASGGASLSAGLGVSGGAGLSASGGAGAGLSVGVSGGAGISGGASAGVTASAGAFAGLRASAGAQGGSTLNTSLLIRRSESVSVATDSGATFRVGGQAGAEGSTSLSADVGARASLRSRIQFD